MILLDTCTLLWLAMDQTRLSTRAKVLLRDNAGALFVSVVSALSRPVCNRGVRAPLWPLTRARKAAGLASGSVAVSASGTLT